MIKLIVSDLDGTLLKRYKSISKANVDAMTQAQSKGIKVALATGRGFDSTKQFIKTLKLDQFEGFLIVNNGQRIIDAKTLQQQTNAKVSIELAKKAMRFAKTNNLQLILDGDEGLAFYSPKELELYRDIYRVLIRILPYFRVILGRIHIFSLFGFLKNQPVKILRHEDDISVLYDKIGLAHAKKQLDLHEAELKTHFSDEFEVMRVSPNWLDLSPKGITKHFGIVQVMKRLNIEEDEVMVLGDSENDISMLKAFKYSFAMGNAHEDIKSYANFIALSNQEDGVAHAIHQYALNNEHET
jgi:Cof subfamily protein (haloacid dehalogenase superfamily)